LLRLSAASGFVLATQKLGGITGRGTGTDRGPSYNQSVIYCVIPPELADELYDKMVEYYKDNPNVTVIIDRRKGPDRRGAKKAGDDAHEQRKTRDRRRPRIPGTFPETDAPSE
jgi:hypothetical protein